MNIEKSDIIQLLDQGFDMHETAERGRQVGLSEGRREIITELRRYQTARVEDATGRHAYVRRNELRLLWAKIDALDPSVGH